MTPCPLLIRGGTVVDPALSPPVFQADIRVDAGRITAVGQYLDTPDNAEILDASGCWVLPGGIDPHTHFELSINGEHVSDDFLSGTLAAACGGTTTVVEHPGFGPAGCDPLHQMRVWRKLTDGRSVVDFGLHLVFQPEAPGAGEAAWAVPAGLPAAVAAGYASGKAYTTYEGKLDDAHLLQLMAAMKQAGCLLAVHAENDAMPAWLREHGTLPASDPRAYPASRPAPCEAEAVTRILALARIVDVPVYIVHVSTAAALKIIKAARRAGQTVYAETCPQYLLLTDRAYAEAQGIRYVMAPPPRTDADREALWTGLAAGDVDVLATDHCSFSLARKQILGATSAFRCPGGVPGVETRLPLLFTHGVLTGRISPQRFAAVTAANPARIFGLPTKGRLAPSLDADILVLDPALERPLRPETLHQRVDYCPYDRTRPPAAPDGTIPPAGTARGWPRHLLLRGRTLIRDTTLAPHASDDPQGRFLPRRLP